MWMGFCISSLLLAVLVAPSTSYSVAEFGRQNGANVSGDNTALVGLEKASSIEEGQESRMVTVENNFGQAAIEVTVELTPPSRSEGDLIVNGSEEGNATRFTLQPGYQQAISACFVDDGNGVSEAATFNATFVGTGTSVSGEIGQRSIPIVDQKNESTDC